MPKYFGIKNRHHSKSQDAKVPGATTKSGEPLTPLLASQDENFLAKVINDVEPEDIILPGSPPASPQPTVLVPPTEVASTPATPQVVTGSDGGWKEGLKAKWGYLESLGSVSVTRLGEAISIVTDKGKGKDKAVDPVADGGESTAATSTVMSTPGTATSATASPHEIVKEDRELTYILELLNCTASVGQVFSTSSASFNPIISKFTEILKDTVNAAPTAYNDLVSLLDSSSSIFEMTYETLPSFLKELITDMLTREGLYQILPEPAKTKLKLRELVTTPGAIPRMFRAGVKDLKQRFPMLLSERVAIVLAVFVVLFALWHRHKRGKEGREEREERERMETPGVEKIKTEKELARQKVDKEKETKEMEKERGEKKKQKWWSLL